MVEDQVEKNILKDITKLKRRLIKKAEKSGLWENFGQKEIRELTNKYGQYLYSNIDTKPIFEFDDWCGNYDAR